MSVFTALSSRAVLPTGSTRGSAGLNALRKEEVGWRGSGSRVQPESSIVTLATKSPEPSTQRIPLKRFE